MTIRKSVLNPSRSSPSCPGLRFGLTDGLLGKLERLGKFRFDISELGNLDVERWTIDNESTEVLVQSVSASCEIEGEPVAADELPLVIAAVTDAQNGGLNAELSTRARAVKEITQACLWALTRDARSFISLEFVKELHQRMFGGTKPQVAGKLKQVPIVIRGGGYDVQTLPESKVDEYLNALCNRTNAKLELAEKHAEASMFLTTAEFLTDFLAIHPFADGNGRTARLLSTYLLEKSGYHFARFYSADSIILDSRKQYYEALFNAQSRWYLPDEDLTMWIEYYTGAVFEQAQRAYQRIRDHNLKRGRNGVR